MLIRVVSVNWNEALQFRRTGSVLYQFIEEIHIKTGNYHRKEIDSLKWLGAPITDDVTRNIKSISSNHLKTKQCRR